MAVDEAKLNEFLGKAVGDLGAAMSAALILVGDRLGLYRELAKGAVTSTSWRNAPEPTSATSANGSGTKAQADTWSTTPRPTSGR